MERAAGIEPASLAWKAKVLPLHNARVAPSILAERAQTQEPRSVLAIVPLMQHITKYRSEMQLEGEHCPKCHNLATIRALHRRAAADDEICLASAPNVQRG